MPPRTSDASPAATLLAAIDLGSNSFRLEVAHLERGRYRRQLYLKETVRLGGGLDADGLLTEPAIERGLACLRRFAEALATAAPQRVRAVATQTLREARNRDAFLVRAREALGRPIEVISGREEARLIYSGVAHLQPGDRRRLVVDIGGRSTELIIGEGQQPLAAESFAVGSVGLSMRFFGDGRFTPAAFRAAQVAAGAEFEEALQTFGAGQWAEAMGSSGTVGAVSQVLEACGQTDGRITPAALRWCIERCLEAGQAERLALPGLRDDRRPVIGGGLAILYTLAANFGIERLLPAKGALRQGVIFDLHERDLALRRAQPTDLRDLSVLELQQRFGVDTDQAARVQALALALYAQARPQAADEARRELGWAAALHEIGQMVSHHDHHRHSAYLLAHVDAPGFSQSQQRRVGELVLAQRGGLRKIEDALANDDFAWRVLCLRLAVIACHARQAHPEAAFALHARARKAQLAIDPGWAARHPRTMFLLGEEAAAWARNGPLALEF